MIHGALTPNPSTGRPQIGTGGNFGNNLDASSNIAANATTGTNNSWSSVGPLDFGFQKLAPPGQNATTNYNVIATPAAGSTTDKVFGTYSRYEIANGGSNLTGAGKTIADIDRSAQSGRVTGINEIAAIPRDLSAILRSGNAGPANSPIYARYDNVPAATVFVDRNLGGSSSLASTNLANPVQGILRAANFLQSSPAAPISALPNVSLLVPFAVFGNDVNNQNVTINGNVGISNGGTLIHAGPSTINGDLHLGIGATARQTRVAGIITGATFTNENLTSAQNQVFTASSTLAGLTPNATFGTVNTSQIFGSLNGIADVTVINIATLSLASGESITFVGDPGDYFNINISTDLNLSGNAFIGSTAQASHTFINITAVGNLGGVSMVGNVINGTILIPNASATFHSANGAVWGGNGEIKFQSAATINGIPFDQVPEASTTSLLTVGLIVVAGLARRLRRCRA